MLAPAFAMTHLTPAKTETSGGSGLAQCCRAGKWETWSWISMSILSTTLMVFTGIKRDL